MGLSVDPPRNAVPTALGNPVRLKVGNRLPPLIANLFRPDGQPASLAGTITFRMREVVTRRVIIAAGPVTLQDPGTASVRYDWEAGVTDQAGVFEAWFDHTVNGLVESYPSQGGIHVRIEP